jgi:hypothetical protein
LPAADLEAVGGAQRLSESFDTLGCSALLDGTPNPVELEMDGDVVTGATFHAPVPVP